VAKSDLQDGQQVLYGSEGEWPAAMWWPRVTCRLANRYYTGARGSGRPLCGGQEGLAGWPTGTIRERGGVAGRYVVARKDLQVGQQVLYEI
jgi:hypothetical protein